MDAFPTKSTQSQLLRESVNKLVYLICISKKKIINNLNFYLNREKMNEIVRQELQKEHIEKMKRLKEKKLHEQIQEKIKYNPKEIDKKLERQTRKLKLEQRSREEEYEQKINDLNQSLDNRKLQIEKYEEDRIKKALEKKYQDVLRKAGLTEYDLR
jgi:hypothetical protein